ncbi:alpha/beta hydrolase [Nocardioides houyundeii]|uniref:alpha/beta hydrolase n=1 Tax=Nocardioides houyundeii TaxID=2045452 RepID=UPI000C771982|nr:alpha/beta hydrolase [Nocardioides houyundeii]
MSFFGRQVVIAALTANALRPLRSFRSGVVSFLLGFVSTEVAPQLLAATALDAAAHLPPRRRHVPGLVLACFSMLGLGWVVTQSRRSRVLLEDALVQGLGAENAEQLDSPTPAERATRWRRFLNPFGLRDARVSVERDVAYAEGGRRARLDIYRPAQGEGLEHAPVLIQVHGGGWTVGQKEHQALPLMHYLAAQGWVCVAVNYRLAPRHPFPAQIIDVKRAIAWVKEHIAEYGGDPGHVVITGGSAGGHLAALAALTPGDPAYQPGFEDSDTSVQACVPVYGVYDFAGATGLRSATQMRDLFLAPRVLRKRWRDAPEEFEAASPILRVTPEAPDFFVLHGTHDTLVDVNQARLFVAELRRTSRASVVYAELPGTQHAFDFFHSIRSGYMVSTVGRYLTWHWNRHREGLDVEVS